MTLLAAPALLALLLALPLVALHLRRRRPPRRAVGSLLAWRNLPRGEGAGARRLARPPLPLLLALQLLALALLVFALADPVSGRGAAGSSRVYVVGESMWMGVKEGGEPRLAAARADLRERLARLPGSEAVRIVAAGTEPSLVYTGPASGAGAALSRLRVGPGGVDLAAALRLAAGLRAHAGDRVLLLRAPEDVPPAVRGGGGDYADIAVGHPVEDVGLLDPGARCDRLGEACEGFVRVRDRGAVPRDLPVRIEVGDRPARTETVHVAAGGSAPLSFKAPPGAAVKVDLPAGDALAADDSAFVSVPAPGGERITLVGERTRSLPLARALASVPGVRLRLRTPRTYAASDAGTSDLLVLDGFMPKGGLPAAPGLLLVDPPRLPGGRSTKMRDSRLSGVEAASPLLEGVELASLTIGGGASRRLVLPPALTAAAWSPSGPLVASGVDRGRRVALISFEPSESNLPQLASFPTLIDNIVAWTQRLAPAAVAAGTPFALAEPPGTTAARLAPAGGGAGMDLELDPGSEIPPAIDRPGNYRLAVRGPWGTRRLAIAVNPAPAPAAGGPVDLGAPPPAQEAGREDWWPWILVGALVVLALELLYSWWREPRRGGAGRRRAAVALRIAGLACVGVALLDLTAGSAPPPTTLVVDRSLSIGAAAGETERAWLAASEGRGGDFHLVQFGGSAELTAPDAGPRPAAAGGSLVGRETDLRGALELALARTPDGGRIVLLSDGRQTSDEAMEVAPAARRRGISIDTVPLADDGDDAAVTRLWLPAAAHAGDPMSLEVTVRATVAAPATLTVRREGVPIGHQRVRLRVGDNPYLFSIGAPRRPGSYGYEVEVRGARDRRSANDALAATVRVGTAPRLLVAGGRGSRAARLLEADGFAVTAVAPGGLPTTARGLDRVDGVVLDDLPAAALGAARAKAIDAAVRHRALGLLALGGDHSFSLGKYYESPLQGTLPVKSLVPGRLQRKTVAVELVLDRSGSMIAEVGGVPKITMAQAAARAAVNFLAKHRDEVGAIAFDVAPHTLLPLTRLSPRDVPAVEEKIATLRADGGTDIYRALAAGTHAIEASAAPHRHIILLSDGISEPGSYEQLLPILRKGHIAVATVALGSEADFKLLKSIAVATGGNYYRTENARELPKIFAKETRLSARTVRLRGRIGVAAGDPSPITGSLVGQKLPPLGGNVVTTLKPGAAAALLGQDKDHPPDPVLAQWQYGSGRVAAWTPGLSPGWAGAWLGRPRLFQDAARWIERGVSPPPLTPSLAAGDRRELEVAPTSPAGRPLELRGLAGSLTSGSGRTTGLRFVETAPDRWTAPLPRLAAGGYRYALRAAGAGTLTGTLAVPYPAELRPAPRDTTPLGPLAAASGGTVLGAADRGAVEGSAHRLWWLFAALALACFLVGAALRLRGGEGRPPGGQRAKRRYARQAGFGAKPAPNSPEPSQKLQVPGASVSENQ